MVEKCIVLLISGHHYLYFFGIVSPFSLKVRESKPQREHRVLLLPLFTQWHSVRHYFHRAALVCFVRGIPDFRWDVWKRIVGQEVSLAAEIKGRPEICQLHLNMSRARARRQTQGWTEQLLCWVPEQSTTPVHPPMHRPYRFTIDFLLWQARVREGEMDPPQILFNISRRLS